MVKNLPAMQETQVQFLGQEDPPEKGMATHSSVLAWRILWTEEHGRLQTKGLQRVGHNWVTNTSTFVPVVLGSCLWQLLLCKTVLVRSVRSLCTPMDCSLPSSSVHGTSQARILEWFVISSSRGSSRHRDWTCVSCITGRCLITEPPGIVKWYFSISIFPSTFINWKSSIRKSYPFSLISSFNQLFVYITINSWIWAFSIGYNSSLSSFSFFFFFFAQVIPELATGMLLS